MSQNKERNTYFLLTMDCERVRDKDFSPAGPLSWLESEKNIMAFSKTASSYGYKVTYFAVPEAVEQHADIFKELIKSGHEVGLHLHPHTFRFGVNEHLGNLPYDKQCEIIKEASDVIDAALGFPPTSFRAGFFSANQDTFRALEFAGFKRGSSSIPGRNILGSGGDWGKWPRHCQYVNSYFEVPLTVDYFNPGRFRYFCLQRLVSLVSQNLFMAAARKALCFSRSNSQFTTNGDKYLLDLRIEDCGYSMLRTIVSAELERIKEENVFPVLTSLTHNYISFTGGATRKDEYGWSRLDCLKRFFDYMNHIKDVAIKPTTLSALQNEYDRANT